MGKILKRAAITNDNLLKYLTDKYDVNSVQSCIKVNQLEGMTPLLQDDYGKDYDCTLTAITQILLYYLKGKTPEEIYNVVAPSGHGSVVGVAHGLYTESVGY